MLFSSITFLYFFLPLVLVFYYIVPYRFKNIVILAFSLAFYAWGEPKYILLMLVSVLAGYLFGLLIEKSRGTGKARFWLVCSAVFSLGILGYFKYADFFIKSFNGVTGLGIPLLRLALPVGISFYTFQILSYTVDVYRGNARAQKSFVNLAAYIALFPQLIAGPIVRYTDIEKQLVERKITTDKIYYGVKRFIIGLAKKVLIANVLGEFCELFRASDNKSVLFYWAFAVAYSLHIYFDFSGYSDMAIGLGRMLGFEFVENFNYPYISKSITEFWRRWHISLGSWFRDYVYIPLGGSRCSKGRLIFNIIVVWALTGFWHGAAWNFIAWGVLYAVLLIIEKMFLLKYLKYMPTWLCHIYTMFFVILGFVLFNAESGTMLVTDIQGIFGVLDIPFSNSQTFYYINSYRLVLLVGIVGATPLMTYFWKSTEYIMTIKARLKGRENSVFFMIIENIFFVACLILSTAYLVDGSFNPFLYFRF